MGNDHKNISRRDFLKATLLSLGATFLSACGRALGITPTPSPTLTPTSTNTPEPAATDTPTATPTPTDTPSPTPIPCFKLLTPENGTKLPATGKVTFSWEAMQGAISYQLQFTFPSGQPVTFDTENINSTRYIESFIAGGIYTWQVIALDNNNTVICVAEPFTFEKPAYTPPKNNGGGDGSGADGSGSTASGAGASASSFSSSGGQ